MKLRTSSSIYPFQEKALKTWKLECATPKKWNEDVVFFGMYHLGDYESFIRHTGKRIIIWAGGDIRNLLRGYAFSDGKELWKSKLFRFVPWHWIFKIWKAEHFVENKDEQDKLVSLGIKADIVPTFLEDINDFPVCYKKSHRPQVYISARKGQEEEYGVNKIHQIALELPDFTFHIYGIEGQDEVNIKYHGNVPQKRFNDEIKAYQIALRMNISDGFSEILAKGILMGQVVISRIKYPYINNYETDEQLINLLKTAKPNPKAREYYKFNQFPFLKR
jgi:hypothetical protein